MNYEAEFIGNVKGYSPNQESTSEHTSRFACKKDSMYIEKAKEALENPDQKGIELAITFLKQALIYQESEGEKILKEINDSLIQLNHTLSRLGEMNYHTTNHSFSSTAVGDVIVTEGKYSTASGKYSHG